MPTGPRPSSVQASARGWLPGFPLSSFFGPIGQGPAYSQGAYCLGTLLALLHWCGPCWRGLPVCVLVLIVACASAPAHAVLGRCDGSWNGPEPVGHSVRFPVLYWLKCQWRTVGLPGDLAWRCSRLGVARARRGREGGTTDGGARTGPCGSEEECWRGSPGPGLKEEGTVTMTLTWRWTRMDGVTCLWGSGMHE